MMKLMMFGGGAVAFAMMAAAGSQMMDKERAEAVSQFEITEAELPLMNACEKLLRFDRIEFKSGVSEISGCGCVAREIYDNIQPREAEFATSILATLVLSELQPDAVDVPLVELEAQLRAKHQMTKVRSQHVQDSMAYAVATCAARDVYRTPEENARVAAHEAAEAERNAVKNMSKIDNARIAFDIMVKEGTITRAEADRRLATMMN